MLDALFKPKFYSKCKSRLKLIKTRLERIRNKRNAVQKFLKKDIVDLLRSAHVYNAYGRAEGLLLEKNMLSCYELILQFANCVLDHVGDLCKQRDCPRECKEAIQSLIYAAARFSDLPELRELRTLFTGKFGNSLQPYISKEFVEKLRQDRPSQEMKIQLLHDLAQEFSIEWDNKALEHRLHSPSHLHEERAKPKSDPVNDHEEYNLGVPKIDNLVTAGRTSNGIERDNLCNGNNDNNDSYWRPQSSSIEDETTTDNSSLDGHKACSSSLGSLSENEAETKRPFSYKLVPPPYVKEKLNKGESNLKKPTESKKDERVIPEKSVPRSVRRRPLKPPIENNILTDGTEKVDSNEKQCQQTKLADEEERIMDELLMHYSKKQSPKELSKAYPLKQNSSMPPVRGISLPHEDTSWMETLKVHGRATSLVPEMLRTARHVHPSLPDYDDLLARLAALKNTIQPA